MSSLLPVVGAGCKYSAFVTGSRSFPPVSCVGKQSPRPGAELLRREEAPAPLPAAGRCGRAPGLAGPRSGRAQPRVPLSTGHSEHEPGRRGLGWSGPGLTGASAAPWLPQTSATLGRGGSHVNLCPARGGRGGSRGVQGLRSRFLQLGRRETSECLQVCAAILSTGIWKAVIKREDLSCSNAMIY